MSTFQTAAGNLQTVSVILTDTSATTVVPVSDNYQVVEFVHIAEVAGSTTTVIVDIYDGSAVVAKLRGTLALTANTPVRIDGPFVLEPGQSLRATAGAGNDVHVTATLFAPTN